MSEQDRLYIIIPAYNEKDNIRKTIEDWYPVIEKHVGGGHSRLIVINDGSTDNTYDILSECAKNYPLLLTMTKKNGGHGHTVLYGYRYAIENGADFIFQTDADGQTDPAEFEQFWNSRDSYDAIIGKRTLRGDGKCRKFVEDTVCVLLRLIFGVKIEDANAPYRLMKGTLVAKYIDKLPNDFNIPNIMLTTYFVYYKERVRFVKITFKPRQGGTNSIDAKKIIKIGWKAIGDFIKLRREIKESE